MKLNAQAAWSTLLCVLMARIAGAAGIETPALPQALKVPADQVLAIAARGVGVQIYECVAAQDDPSRYSWTLKAPEAVLRLKSGATLGKHYAGPTWEATDGSRVIGEVAAKLDAPNGTAIAWLLLRAKSTSGAGKFSAITSIQRLRTVGGKAPAAGCDQTRSGQEVRVRYSAEYRFFTARP
ncbi:MAG: DUF3455 domain-containing protein [Steroidobacteraceae bacterium]